MPEENWLNDDVFTIEDLLPEDECCRLIQLAETLGFDEATVSTPRGDVVLPDLRNNDRLILESDEIARDLWERCQDFVPIELDGRVAVGVNELIRFYRYEAGQQFDWHQDFPFERDNGDVSVLTLLIYLNEVEEGGETAFDDSYSSEVFEPFHIEPVAGMALLFVHETHHKGEPVVSGCKYVLRSDVMFRPID